MRLVLASLIAAAAVPALAQTPPPTAAPPASAPQPAAAPPGSAPPAATPPAAEPTPPPAPPAPPPPPTDPAAIALMSTLDSVCVPAIDGGNLDKLARADGYRKSGDNGWVLHGRGFTFTILPPGSNPNQCHVDLVHPVDVEAPGRPMVVALHNWAAVARGWSLYRNDKNVAGDEELTTRSWEHDETGAHEALVITTYRHANGAPMRGGSDTSTLIYSKSHG